MTRLKCVEIDCKRQRRMLMKVGLQSCKLKLAGGVDYGGMNGSVRCAMGEKWKSIFTAL